MSSCFYLALVGFSMEIIRQKHARLIRMGQQGVL